jgi:AcrR family transcriptional regulator
MNHVTETPPETRQRIIDAAIQLFADQGFDATSVRDITTAASCNVAAVNYHFGGKEKLYVEAARSLLGDIQGTRMATLGDELRSPAMKTLEDFLHSFARAFVGPLLSGPRSRVFMTWFAREMVDQRLAPEFFFDEFIKPFMDLALTGMRRFTQNSTPPQQMLCLMSVVGQLMHIVKGLQVFARSANAPPFIPDLDTQIDHIVTFSAAGIRAVTGHNGETMPIPEESA